MMKLLEQLFDQVLVFRPEERKDCRGSMEVLYAEENFAEYAPDFHITEQRIYSIPKAGTFFGIHYQSAQAKLISVIQGRGMDYIVDLRRDSPTFRAWNSMELCGNVPKLVYLPEGFGHGFLTLEENTIQLFAVNLPFDQGIGQIIHYQDPTIGLQFPMEPQIMSDYDRNAPFLTDE